jgi:predicted DNA-binding ribbon-helix-helix protein
VVEHEPGQRQGARVSGDLIIKRGVSFSGRKTSISLEEPFWQVLDEIATARGMARSALIASIDDKRTEGNLSSALRVFVLEHFRAAYREHRGAAW